MSALDEHFSLAEEKQRADMEKAYREVLALQSGKLVIFDILAMCGIYGVAFSGENTNATAFLLGQQEIGKKLIQQLDAIDPRYYPKLLLEVAEIRAMDLEAAEQAARSKLPEDDDEI